MGNVRDWRDENPFAPAEQFSLPQFALQFLLRNRNYQREYGDLVQDPASSDEAAKARVAHRWGLRFPGRSC